MARNLDAKCRQCRREGEPFTVSIRDDVSADQVRALLQQSGVQHVRPDVLAENA